MFLEKDQRREKKKNGLLLKERNTHCCRPTIVAISLYFTSTFLFLAYFDRILSLSTRVWTTRISSGKRLTAPSALPHFVNFFAKQMHTLCYCQSRAHVCHYGYGILCAGKKTFVIWCLTSSTLPSDRLWDAPVRTNRAWTYCIQENIDLHPCIECWPNPR